MNKWMMGGIVLGAVLVVGVLGVLHYKELAEISALKSGGASTAGDGVEKALKNFFGGKTAGEFTSEVVKATKDEIAGVTKDIQKLDSRLKILEEGERPSLIASAESDGSSGSSESEADSGHTHPRFKDWKANEDGAVSVYVRHEGKAVVDAAQELPLVLRPAAPRDESSGTEKSRPLEKSAPKPASSTEATTVKKPTHILCTNGVVHKLYHHGAGFPSGWFLCYDSCGNPCRFKEDRNPEKLLPRHQTNDSKIVQISRPDFRN